MDGPALGLSLSFASLMNKTPSFRDVSCFGWFSARSSSRHCPPCPTKDFPFLLFHPLGAESL